MDRHALYRLKDNPDLEVILLSYPGVERSKVVIVAPLAQPGTFPSAPILNPTLDTPIGPRDLATERLAAIHVRELGTTLGAYDDKQFLISRALSRLFDGN